MVLRVVALARLVALALLVAVLVVQSQGAPDIDGPELQELNEVWVSGPNLSLQKPYKPGFSFKSLMKALYRLNSLTKSQPEPNDSSAPTEFPESLEITTIPAGDVSFQTPIPLVDDLLEILPPVPPGEPDKSHRFTHNFRFGYGTRPDHGRAVVN